MLEFVYDTAGRETIRKATTVGSGFDSAVLRIERAYDSLGRPTTVTQYDAASSGSVTDQTQFAYDDWGPVSSFKIDKDSAISGGGNEYTVSYTYAKATGGRQTVRRSAIALPSSKSITFTYGTSPSHDDELSRVTKVKDGAMRLAEYTYKGTADVVGTSNAEPSMESTVFDPSGSTYPDLDTFGRVTRSKWSKQYPISKDFYKVELTYDRNSNITWALDKVHTGFDVYYTNDPLNRLTAADEGTESSGSITSRTRKQEWTLSHTGNWDREKLDLDGNGSWGGTNEHDDTRTHTKANAISTQDLDSTPGTTGNNYSLTHDLVGNLTNDAQSYKYEWDVFGRLRKVKNQSNTLVAEYRYNGLGFRIAWHEDTDNDGDADASDKWFYPMYDEAWRMLAVFRESDSSPKEEWVPQLAGLDGYGGSSMLDGVICRYRDANNAWTAASDGVLEERRYLCQNWRGDVSAVIDTNGAMVEWVKYFSYGIPFALPAGDTNSDGDCDASDITQIQTWIDAPAYDIRGDLDLDGDVDATDKSTAQGSFQGTTLGFSVLSNIGNRRGYAGYERDIALNSKWHARHRQLGSDLGRWCARDPWKPGGSQNLYYYVECLPMGRSDPLGLQGQDTGSKPTSGPASQSRPHLVITLGDLTYHVPNTFIQVEPQDISSQGLLGLWIHYSNMAPTECESVYVLQFKKVSYGSCGPTLAEAVDPALLACNNDALDFLAHDGDKFKKACTAICSQITKYTTPRREVRKICERGDIETIFDGCEVTSLGQIGSAIADPPTETWCAEATGRPIRSCRCREFK